MLSTGWWGIPGRENSTSKVHAVKDGKPICGKSPHPKSQYQWCCHGFNREYIECQKCRELIDRQPSLESVIRSLRDAARSLAELTARSKDNEIGFRTRLLINEIQASERVVKPIGLSTTLPR